MPLFSAINTTNLDAGTDSPANARADLKTAVDNINTVGAEFAVGDGAKLAGIATNANNYTHPSTDGNLHVPATSTTNDGKVLTAGSTAGSLTWETPSAGGASIGETCVFEVNATSGGNYGGLETSPYSRTIFSFTDPSSYYSLSGYQLTLPAGTYTLEHFQPVIDATDSHTWSTVLYNATTSTAIAYSEDYNEIGTQGEGLYAFSAIFTLATSTAIEIRGSGSYYIPTQRFKLTHIA
jgi:hypothetical protein